MESAEARRRSMPSTSSSWYSMQRTATSGTVRCRRKVGVVGGVLEEHLHRREHLLRADCEGVSL
eukprot:47816-Eustigmatos_ZCMA.PRE.1